MQPRSMSPEIRREVVGVVSYWLSSLICAGCVGISWQLLTNSAVPHVRIAKCLIIVQKLKHAGRWFKLRMHVGTLMRLLVKRVDFLSKV